MDGESSKKICQKCGRLKDVKYFYTYKDGSKCEMCKDCLTLHVDNFDPTTFLWLLEKFDMPYIEEEWNVLRDRAYAKSPNLNGVSVFGKYLSKMKLQQFKDYGWGDTEKIKQQREAQRQKRQLEQERFEQVVQAKYNEGVMSEAEYKTLMSTEQQHAAYEAAPHEAPTQEFYNEANFLQQEDLVDYGSQLTQDDKIALAMKWGRLYQPYEWVELERMYEQMMESFDIQDADTMNTLILLCKTTLKMNQAIDTGDVEGYQKLSKVSDSLRKSAKFTAAQNKEQKNDYVDSVGELVAMCEKEGFIPRYATDIPQDKVDITLRDMNEYVRKLVTQDLGFGKQIEEALKKIQIQQEMAEAASEDGGIILSDEDISEYHDSINEQKDLDAMMASIEQEIYASVDQGDEE